MTIEIVGWLTIEKCGCLLNVPQSIFMTVGIVTTVIYIPYRIIKFLFGIIAKNRHSRS